MTRIKLSRPPEKSNSGAVMDVYLNGACVAQVANGSTTEIEVVPGLHFLKLKADNQGSKKHKFNINEGELKTFTLSTNNNVNRLGAFGAGVFVVDIIVNGFLLLYYFTTGHNRYLQVTETRTFA